MLHMIYKGDPEQEAMFPRLLKTGYINEKDEKSPYILLQSDEFTLYPDNGGNLTDNLGCQALQDKIATLEQCFDDVTIALIGIDLVSSNSAGVK